MIIQEKIQAVPFITRCQLAQDLNISEDALDFMLAILITKGRVTRIVQPSCMGKCCKQAQQIIYTWKTDSTVS